MKVFLYLICFAYVHGAVYWAEINVEMVNGTPVMFCKYGNVKLFLGSEYIASDICAHCVCRGSGLDCQTLPTAVGIIAPDDSSCISKTIDCKNRWVMRNNNNVDCPPNLIPEPVAMVGK